MKKAILIAANVMWLCVLSVALTGLFSKNALAEYSSCHTKCYEYSNSCDTTCY